MIRTAVKAGLIACCAWLAPAAPSRAGIIYDSGVALSGITSNVISDANPPANYMADDFTLATAARVDHVQWAGVYSPAGTDPTFDDFTIQIFDFSGASPATTPLYSFAVGDAVGRTATGRVSVGRMIYSYEAAIPAADLAPGRYLLSIFDDTRSFTSVNFAWSMGNSPGGQVFTRRSQTDGWVQAGAGFVAAFTLSGPTAVPEPSSLALFGVGSLGLLARLHSRRRAR